MSTVKWEPQLPFSDPPSDPLPPTARALLRRLDAWAERTIANNPALAEAIRRGKPAAQAEAERAGQGGER